MSTPPPLISVGLPVYNGAKYIEATIESILQQSVADFELLISDNASTDGTEDICRRYVGKDRRVYYHRNAVNLGAAPNYNRAYALARGRFFKWADYDDLLAPTFLAECLEGLERNPGAVVSFPNAVLIDRDGRRLADYTPQPDTSSTRPHDRFGRLVLWPDHYAIQASGLMRTEVVGRTVLHGSYPCSDEVFLAHLSLLGPFHNNGHRSMHVRVHPGQSTKGALASDRARVHFFDTTAREEPMLVRWEYLKGCLQSIDRSPLEWAERARCYGYLLQWAARGRNSRGLVKDLLLATHRRLPLFDRLRRDALDAAQRGKR